MQSAEQVPREEATRPPLSPADAVALENLIKFVSFRVLESYLTLTEAAEFAMVVAVPFVRCCQYTRIGIPS